MRVSAVWAVLLLPAGILAQGCPADCQCHQPQTVFCISRRSSVTPQGLPPGTAHLYLFENGIRLLSEDSFAGLSALRLLDLSQNQITSLPRRVFQPLPSLSNLDLSSNQLHEVTNESFHGLHLLERLYLGHNRLRLIHPAAFGSLENLLELKLQDNQLQGLPPLHLPTLLLLDISRNPIAALQPSTFHAQRLESLKMAGLGLGGLGGDILQHLRNLHELDLSDNRLARVPGALSQLRGLTKLSLAGNDLIAELQPEDFRELQGLQELDLSGLNLRGLPWDFLGAFPGLRAVALAENPFNCVCQMSWLVGWLSLGKASLRRPEETRCHFPPQNAGRLLQQLQYADFGCPTAPPGAPPGTPPLQATSPTLAPPIPPSSRPDPLAPSRASPPARNSSLGALPEGWASPVAPLCPTNACLNGGICQPDPPHRPACVCPLGFTGPSCEAPQAQAVTPAEPSQAQQLAVRRVGGTSLKVDLQGYIRSKAQLKGIRMTYWNLSGPDKRPVTLRLPATLPEYTVRALKPNSSYQICVGALGDQAHQQDLCVEAQTLHLTHQQHTSVSQSSSPDLTLVALPCVAAGLLLLAAAAAGSYYVHRRRRAKRAAPRGSSASPLELEGVKGDLAAPDPGTGPPPAPKPARPDRLQHEVPLMQQPQGAGPMPLRAPRASYF